LRYKATENELDMRKQKLQNSFYVALYLYKNLPDFTFVTVLLGSSNPKKILTFFDNLF